MTNLDKRLDTAYSKLGLREPFIAAVVMSIKREVSDKVPTAGTNGSWIRYNPAFCDPLGDEELFGLVLHESCHVVLMHMWRRDDRDPALWNYANDAIINAYIRSRGWKLPAGGVELRWVREEHSSEEVYAKLKENPPPPRKSKGGKGDGDGEDGDDQGQPDAGGFDGKGDIEDAVDEATRTHMEAVIMTAAKMAKDCGQGTAMVDRVLSMVGKSSVRWQDVTRSMLTESSAADYTYMRPSRRFIGQGLYLPSLRTEALGGLAIGFDTSGSMGQRECDQIGAELQAIVDDLNPAFIEIAYCDYAVTHVERFERDDPIKLHPKGGGGTRFAPVFEHFAEADERPVGLIFFTDLEGNLQECVDPGYPVVWADIGRSHPAVPFGTRVEVPL